MYCTKNDTRIHQGDILEDITYKFTKLYSEPGSIFSISLPYVIVMTQDCDLESDFRRRFPEKVIDEVPAKDDDKLLQSILTCPCYLSEELRTGSHLSSIGLTMENWNKDRWAPIKTNQNERFHFIEEDAEVRLPDLVVDFKHYYTIPTDDVYKIKEQKYKVSLDSLYREDISIRFANYISRIGLPQKKKTASANTQTNQ